MRKLLVSLLATGALTLGFAAPAKAALPTCPAQTFCMWTDINGTGSRYTYSRNSFVLAYQNGIRLKGSGIWNNADTWLNNLGDGWDVNIYDSEMCNSAGWYRTVVAGQYATAQGSDWGNIVSSIQLQNASPLLC